ncbi:MAG: hypothetical protein M3373_09930 [Gemmatimonadota bacterium]|nr:hypothetical protein [Gemmatimonadota bacterium]
MLHRLTALAITLALLAPLTPALGAQDFVPRPHLTWRSVTTRHFVFHYPAEMAAWTLDVAGRIEAVHEAVSRIVGYAPAKRVTIIVDDPANTSNGSAWPLLDAPAVVLWPAPPDPASGIGNNRGWGEILAVHELAHIAHLTRPSRNARWRRLWSFSPVRFSPIPVRSPRWLIEGYATHVEGVLTGSGRPHGVVRPAVLRQWALEGKLPAYGQLNGLERYQGGSMAYLAGSAYLEWLVARRGLGDSSLVHLSRRMSARRDRGFGDAFTGVFGGTPSDLYDRFTAEVTGLALEAEQVLRSAGLAMGDTVQRLDWGTGAPSLSGDDSLIAVQLRHRDRPSRVVIWRTAPDTAAERRAREERERLLKRDPEDVAAVEHRPRAKSAVAVLLPVAGRAHDGPRFFAEGERVLVSRLEPRGDGSWRSDLFIWEWEQRRLRRVTRGAAVRDADPSPDGRTAVAQRCLNGICDVVRVDLSSGAVTTFLRGSVDGGYARPRWSPDGRQIVAARQGGGRWRLVVARADDPASERTVGPDDGASRYDAAWLPGGDALVAVSEASGIANLERIDIALGSTRPLTSVTGAALAPAPTADGRAIYFLSLHAQGLDLNRIATDGPRVDVVRLDARLGPAARVAAGAPRDSWPPNQVSEPRSYGAGPRRHRVFPGGTVSAGGHSAQLVLGSTDPVGRLTWLLQGAYGDRSMWRGAALSAAWRGWRPEITGDLFFATQRPSEQRAGSLAPSALDAEYAGATIAAGMTHELGSRLHRWRAGASLGSLDGPGAGGAARQLIFAEYVGGIAERHEQATASLSVALHGAAGSTGGNDWRRAVGTVALRVAGVEGLGARASVTYGEVSRDAPPYERFVAGGARSSLFDPAVFSQRVTQPALPLGIAAGRRLLALRASTTLLGLDAYAWAVSADEDFTTWHRLLGAERTFGLETIPLVHLPNVSAQVGAGYSLDQPFQRKVRAYLSLGFRP